MTPLEVRLQDLQQRVELCEAQNSSATGFIPALNDMARKTHDMVDSQNRALLQQIDQLLEDKWNDYLTNMNQGIVDTETTLHALINIILVGDRLSEEEMLPLKQQLVKYLTRYASNSTTNQ